MSQSEGGEYPLPALFCKVTSHFVFVFVFWIFCIFISKVDYVDQRYVKYHRNWLSFQYSNQDSFWIHSFLLVRHFISFHFLLVYLHVLLGTITMSSQVSNNGLITNIMPWSLLAKVVLLRWPDSTCFSAQWLAYLLSRRYHLTGLCHLHHQHICFHGYHDFSQVYGCNLPVENESDPKKSQAKLILDLKLIFILSP